MITTSSSNTRAFLTAVFTAGSVMLSVQAEAADNRLCKRLEVQLSEVGRSSPDAQRYERAIRAQERELGKLRSQVADMDCRGFIANLAGRCSDLKSSMSRMENNLAELRATRDGMGGASAQRERLRLTRAISESGCRAPAQAAPLTTAGAFPAAPSTAARAGDQKSAENKPRARAVVAEAAEQAANEAKKGGLKPAPKDGFSVVAGQTQPASPPAAPTPEPVRVPTLASSLNSASSLAAEAAQTASENAHAVEADIQTSSVSPVEPVERDYPKDRTVRVVGPMFLPDPEEALDLRSPGRKLVQ